MDRLRRILKRVLPAGWWDRIDLENASIRKAVTAFGPRIGAGARVLDAGSGQCRYRDTFAHTRYVGVDFGRGEDQWDYSGLDVIGRLEDLPFRNECFDAVICTQVLEHLAEPELVLRELARITREGGSMLLTAPLGFGEHQVPYDFYRYTRYGLKHLLEKTGWRVRHIEPRGGYFRYMAVMMMWTYLYLFPGDRPAWLKILLAPLQAVSALVFIMIGPPILQSLDMLDTERRITLGFAAECIRTAGIASKHSDAQGG